MYKLFFGGISMEKREPVRLVPKIAKSCIFGLLAGSFTAVLLLLLGAALVSGGVLSDAHFAAITVTAALFSGLVGGFVSGRICKDFSLAAGGVTAILLIVLRYVLSACSESEQQGYASGWVVACLLLLGGVIGGLLGRRRKKKLKR